MDIDGYRPKLCALYRPMLYKINSFYGICGDVYDRLENETHATDKTMRYL